MNRSRSPAHCSVDTAISVLLVAALTGVFVWSLWDAAQRPHRYTGVMNDLTGWGRAARWIVAVTLAAVVGLSLADASEYVVGVVAVIGFVLTAVASDFWGAALYNEWMRRFFGR